MILKPLDNAEDPVWSVIILLIVLLVGVTYYIYTIMKYSFGELNDGKDDTPEQEELLQLSGDGD